MDASNTKCHSKFLSFFFDLFPCQVSIFKKRCLAFTRTLCKLNEKFQLTFFQVFKNAQGSIPTGARIVDLEVLREGLKKCSGCVKASERCSEKISLNVKSSTT